MTFEKNISLGVCTWTFGDLPLSEISQRIAVLGFDGVELNGNLSLYSAPEAKRVLEDAGLAIFSLTPDNVDLAHPDPDIRRKALDYYHQLLDFAAELSGPLISCHGLVGRVAAIDTQERELAWLTESVRKIAGAGQKRGLDVVFEVLNRYETHTVSTGREAVELVKEVGLPNLGILLDAYHMNIEEASPEQTIRGVGSKLWLYHAADSNREGIGGGHTDFGGQLNALREIKYAGPIILECTAPGPNPFTAIKDENSLVWLERYLAQSKRWLDRQMGGS